MTNLKKLSPRVGTVAMAFPGYYLGEEMAPGKYAEFLAHLEGLDLQTVPVDQIVLDRSDARQAGGELARADVDCLVVMLATFVPDHYLVDLLEACDLPVFLWAVEREIDCLSLVGGMLINPTLYELGKDYQLHGADIGDPSTTEEMMVFARAAMLKRTLQRMRIGYMGGHPDIMLSMTADEYGLKKTLGVSVIPLRDNLYKERQRAVSEDTAQADWTAVKESVGQVQAADADGVDASKGFLAMKALANEMQLDALSLNCWPHLKARICLPISRLNDEGIGSGCEGDLHSTILMQALCALSGRAAINGDFLRMYEKGQDNDLLFSHCGAGPMSMARTPADIILQESIETHDGLGIFFPADQPGTVTALNLMGSRAGYRLSAMVGVVQPTDLTYEGTPMRLRFEIPVRTILQAAVGAGAGHHWSLAYGDYVQEFALLCKWLGIEFHLLSKDE